MPHLHLGGKLRSSRFVCTAALVASTQHVSQRARHACASLRRSMETRGGEGARED